MWLLLHSTKAGKMLLINTDGVVAIGENPDGHGSQVISTDDSSGCFEVEEAVDYIASFLKPVNTNYGIGDGNK